MGPWGRMLPTGIAMAVAATACGGDGGSDRATAAERTIDVEMVDIAFKPGQISVRPGQTVRFRFSNEGDTPHDAFIGDEPAQLAEVKRAKGGHGRGHGDAAGITVDPGDSGELTYTFEAGETVLIGCHQPGHYEAGMRITVDVA